MDEERIELAHGSGGKKSHDLVNEVFLKHFSNPFLDRLEDMAVFDVAAGLVAFTTDSYVVKPIFFNGGNIGKLAICGTVNDLAMSGAEPKYISAGFIIEEGFPLEELDKILASMTDAAAEAGVLIVTGDTKVVERGSVDNIFINTAGVGFVPEGVQIRADAARPGDAIILSGSIGDHGITILSQREGLEFSADIESDCAPLNSLVKAMLEVDSSIKALRDPTRGGLATTLNELAEQSGVGMRVFEEKIAVKDGVRGACEMLGLDPLHVANEGKLTAIVDADKAEAVVAAMRKNRYGQEAAIIGEVVAENPGRVFMKTVFGATRVIDMLVGEQLPRIC